MSGRETVREKERVRKRMREVNKVRAEERLRKVAMDVKRLRDTGIDLSFTHIFLS